MIEFDNLTQEEKEWIYTSLHISEYVKYILGKSEEEYFGSKLPKMWNDTCTDLIDILVKDNNIILQNNQTLSSHLSRENYNYFSNNRTKVMCIKDVDVFGRTVEFFQDKIYEIDIENNIYSHGTSIIKLGADIFKNYFLYLSEYREQRINKILEE